MSTDQPQLLDWTPAQFNALGNSTIVGKHRMAESGLFEDDALAELIDNHPPDQITIAAMGDDAGKFTWMEGDRNGLSGREILEVLKTGKIWVNLLRVASFQPEISRLLNQAYDELESGSRGFKAKGRSANLLISSPKAMVFYHVDLPCNVLWHLRGEKHVWVYPLDERFVSQRILENLSVGQRSEDVPYDRSFDDYALKFTLQPGQVATWAQNTPHRVTNLDSLNVSLSSDHRNALSKRRVRVHQANYYLRNLLNPKTQLSSNANGPVAYIKEGGVLAFRAANRMFRGKDIKTFAYRRRFYLDPTVEGGVRVYDGVDLNIDFDAETTQEVVTEPKVVTPA